jgi:hypothetical protein
LSADLGSGNKINGDAILSSASRRPPGHSKPHAVQVFSLGGISVVARSKIKMDRQLESVDNRLIFKRKTGAGDGIRTHDPNLGKVPEALTPGYPAHRYNNFL